MIRLAYIALFWALVATSISGCKAKRVLEQSPLLDVNENFLVEQVKANYFNFEYLNGKLNFELNTPNQKASLKANLRIASDSAMWLSLTPALGIEAARALIIPDTIKFLDKIKNKYYIGDFALIDTVLNYRTEFRFIQNIFVGNPVEISPEEKYTAKVEGLSYVLQTKVKRKLKRAMKEPKGSSKQDSTYTLGISPKAYKRVGDKNKEEDLIVKRYYIRPSDFKVTKTQIDDLYYGQSVNISYDDFQLVGDQLFPMNIKIQVSTATESSNFEISYTRINVNEIQTFPFKIPSNFEPLQ